MAENPIKSGKKTLKLDSDMKEVAPKGKGKKFGKK